MPLNVPVARAHYFWVYGSHPTTGNGVVLGAFTTEEQAREESGDIANPRFFKLKTRDHAKATRQIKAKVLKTSGVREAMQRMKHKMAPTQDFPDEEEETDDDDI